MLRHLLQDGEIGGQFLEAGSGLGHVPGLERCPELIRSDGKTLRCVSEGRIVRSRGRLLFPPLPQRHEPRRQGVGLFPIVGVEGIDTELKVSFGSPGQISNGHVIWQWRLWIGRRGRLAAEDEDQKRTTKSSDNRS